MGYETITDAKLDFQDFQENPSGIEEAAYIIPISWLATEQTTTPSTTAASLVEIATAHIMMAGKTPIQVTPLFENSSAKSDSAGQMLSKMFKPGAKFFLPQVSAQNLGTVTMLKSVRCLVLIKRANGGDFIQIGTGKLAAYVMSASVDLGEGVEGKVGTTLEIAVSASKVPFYIYKGVLPVTGT